VKRTITVLQDDIDNGEKGVSSSCAIARAAKRDLSLDTVLVRPGLLAASGYYAQLPAEATCFILEFDRDIPVEPFKFEVDLKEIQ
jgi:hypothetical protein